MSGWRSTLLRRQFRFAAYVLIVLVLFLLRGPRDWKALLEGLGLNEAGPVELRLAGRDLAPDLVDALLRSYQRDYPQVAIETTGPGTAHALQALLEGRADVALLARSLRSEERSHFVGADDREPIVEPIALGALVLLASRDAPADEVRLDRLRDFLGGEPGTGWERLICEDPNLGLWDALLDSMGVESDGAEATGRVAFARDRRELVEALRIDPTAVGLVSSFALPAWEAPTGLRILAVRPTGGSEPVRPSYSSVGRGRYPLLHHLHLACRAGATGDAAKFVTFATGARGQRLVERAGHLPARHFLREILLDDRPIGAR